MDKQLQDEQELAQKFAARLKVLWDKDQLTADERKEIVSLESALSFLTHRI